VDNPQSSVPNNRLISWRWQSGEMKNPSEVTTTLRYYHPRRSPYRI
jgi:hypothetical protein